MALSEILALVLKFSFIIHLSLAHPSSNINSSFSLEDQQSLLSFRNSISDDWNALQNWNSSVTLCNWTGVICDIPRERVVELRLSGMGLHGFLSPHLGNLSSLERLYLSNNTLGGHIPPQLGRLSRLTELWLNINQLEGNIPNSFSNCQNLVNLSLSNNHLTGLIPPQLSQLTKLRTLYMDGNNLTGTIPSSLSNISTLTELDLSTNNLSGAIPPQLGMISQLESLALAENQLTGQIPASLSNCSRLLSLRLYDNKLAGHIPLEFGAKFPKLQRLIIWGNQLSGNIPNSLANCSQLTLLELAQNRLSGTIPMELGQLALLERLNLWGNQLVSGTNTTLAILTALTNCSHLRIIVLGDNYLSGVLPVSIGQLSTELNSLSLAGNNIGGEIPKQIANLTNLTYLALDHNSFTGPIPSTLGRLRNLERLYLSGNKLEGSIPSEIGQLTGIGLLSLFGNMLSGRIPHTFTNLKQLRNLYLDRNHLSGNIPASLGQSWRLEELDLADNKLRGKIPPEIVALQNLIFLNLSGNMLEGPLPPEVGKMMQVQKIDISKNKLGGQIPATIESCSEIRSLNLSWNVLQGPIPSSIAQLKSLEDVDLSYNNLSGSIPKSLIKLGMLRHLNLSFNNFSGEIPRAGVFTNLTVTSFMGNPGLCGQWLNIPPCSTPSRTKQGDHVLLKEIVIPIVSITCFILCISLVSKFLCSRCWRKSKNALSPGGNLLALNVGHPMISHRELIDATNGFNEANLLGVGSFGAVYKAFLRDGRMAAVKVLNLQNEKAHKSFSTECKALGRVRHRNLVKIITSCSNLQFKALVLEFMPSGSLEKHLYSDNVCELNLRERVNIAIDVARAMEYLHHHSPVQVIHCDLKPANVLIDENMTARVADFGLARITCENSMDLYTSTIKLKGSVGYIAPEYGQGGMVSTKGDVYSYGILLLEMLTRRRPTDDMFAGELNLQKWVSMAFPERMEEVVDESLWTNVSDDENEEHKIYECVKQMMGVSLACTKELSQQRPEMREVVGALESIERRLLEAHGLQDLAHLQS
eukprot:Gb_03533 [translate_table: standard]